MINEYPIDVNFCIAVRPPVPTVIYSHSIEMGVAKPNLFSLNSPYGLSRGKQEIAVILSCTC